MLNVVGVRFKPVGKIYYFDPNNLALNIDDTVIVETSKGVEHGFIVLVNKELDEDDVVLPLKKIVRIATTDDYQKIKENERLEEKAFVVCRDKIWDHHLDMKLASVEYAFDRSKIIFNFTADGRIDFRNLVRDLATAFKTRIELRQIGVRDQAKLIGGIGPCGRTLCCSTFLGDFEPVSIKMAKDQNLSLNPAKISGLCGRLMCCLKYENDFYEEAKRNMPDFGERVETEYGHGKVVGINIFEKIIEIRLDQEDTVIEYTLDELIEQDLITVSANE